MRQEGTIRVGERVELRRLVRLRVKLLRSQIADRHAAQMAEIDGRLAAKFHEDKTRIEALRKELDKLVASANRRVQVIIAKYPDVAEPRDSVFSRPWFTRPDQGKSELRKAMMAAVTATTEKAKLRVATLETELLTELAVDAVKTEAAMEFVRRIPKIDELMPDRLAEIEAQHEVAL